MRAPARTFEDLLVLRSVATTQSSSGLAESASVCACGLPFVTNIAEGFRQRGKADKLRFFNMAPGSLEEGRYYLILSRDLEYGDVSETSRLLEDVSKLLEAYSQSILNSDS